MPMLCICYLLFLLTDVVIIVFDGGLAEGTQVTLEDNVRAQFKLVTEKFGIHQLKLVIGWSMAASQAFQWAASFPDMVERILPFCGSARISPHHIVSVSLSSFY